MGLDVIMYVGCRLRDSESANNDNDSEDEENVCCIGTSKSSRAAI